jgi:hypothetical protein
MTETDTLHGLVPPDATPQTVKLWADQYRKRAAGHGEERDRLNAIADLLYRERAKMLSGGRS